MEPYCMLKQVNVYLHKTTLLLLCKYIFAYAVAITVLLINIVIKSFKHKI